MTTGYMIRECYGSTYGVPEEEPLITTLMEEGVFMSFNDAVSKCKELAQKRYEEFMNEYKNMFDAVNEDIREFLSKPCITEGCDTCSATSDIETYEFSVVSVSIH